MKNLGWSWKFKEATLSGLSDRISWSNNISLANSKLSIKDVQLSDAGFYECKIENDFGFHSRTIELKVKSKNSNYKFKKK